MLWEFPLFIIHLIAIFFNALMHPPPLRLLLETRMPDRRYAPERSEGPCSDAVCFTGGTWTAGPPASLSGSSPSPCPVQNIIKSGVPSDAGPLLSHTQSGWCGPFPTCRQLSLGTIDLHPSGGAAAESCATRRTSQSAAGRGPTAPGIRLTCACQAIRGK